MPFQATFRRIASILALASAVSGAMAGDRLASLPPKAPGLAAGPAARPILAWSDFCRRYPIECKVDGSEPEAIVMTPQVWRLLNEINFRVNRAITPVTDFDHWGVVDKWDFPDDGKGDCEDYQILKRKLLADAGIPRRILRMTVVLDENNEGHAVLMVRTERGDYILDNKRDEVLPWTETGYVYVKRESQSDVAWVSLNNVGSPTVTAARR